MKKKDKMKVKRLLIIFFKSFSYGQSSHNFNALIATFAHYLLMSDGRKNNSKYSSPWFLCGFFTLITMILSANDASSQKIYKPLTQHNDTTAPKNVITDTIPRTSDTLNLNDTLHLKDSLVTVTDTLNIKFSKDTLDAPIDYSASDSIVFMVPEKKIIMYSQGSVKKGDMDLAADSIAIDQETQLVTATFRKDTSGNIVGRPKMVQGGTTMESDVIKYNTKTQKGITQHTLTQQGEIFIQGQKVKKVSENDFFAYRGEFTTCNLDTPHFAFVTKKMKLVNKKLAISGPIHPEFEGVPVPVYIPFGIFPISQGRHSGFLPPSFTTSEQYGLGLQNMGYYKVFSDNFDLETRGDIYTYGGWTINMQPEYRVRYRYNGRMLITLQRTKILADDPKQDFTDTRTFRVNWSHTVDGKARPGTNFSANVNAGSTKFNRLTLGNPMRPYENMMNSSISYSKTWEAFNLTASANHSQNNNTREIYVTLPNIGFTANTFYPLQNKEFTGSPKWYEKLGIGLNSSFGNQINFFDSAFTFSSIIDTMQWGAQHNVPIQLSLPAIGPLQISPGISYGNKMFSRQFIRKWNSAEQKVDTVINKGFYTQHDLSFSISLSTALFGKFEKFGRNSKMRAIRHVIRPTVALSYKPDLTANDFYTDTLTRDGRIGRFSKYERSIFSPFSGGMFGGLSFGIDNNLEAKFRTKDTVNAEGGMKKVRLLDGFGLNGSYNLMADSFKLSNISMYVRSTLFEKINITAGATIDPYQTGGKYGENIDKYAWQGGKFKVGRITNGNLAISTSFKSKTKDEKKPEDVVDQDLPPLTMQEQLDQVEYARQNPAEFADFNIPWSVNISYSLNFYSRMRRDYSGFETDINSNASIGGDFNLTPRWKMGVNSYYDFKTSKIQMLTMFISREMHCWQMSINVTPVGIYRSFNITVSPKSGILRDLRINRTRSFYGG
ncbi:MAG TPA: putative LPS assembly protein LptD [Flavitalea sp.]|nr:putative LPS assembly protein LptD [Flavitalea sp.]